jgi:hypothetical protein
MSNIKDNPMNTTALTSTKPTLTPGYTRMRRIGAMTATIGASLAIEEIAWIVQEWSRFEGGPEDCDWNVIMERITPITGTRIWVMDRDGTKSLPILMLPGDY